MVTSLVLMILVEMFLSLDPSDQTWGGRLYKLESVGGLILRVTSWD